MTALAAIKKIANADYADQNFRSKDLSHTIFEHCSFDRVDMSMADCTGSQFIGCTFRQTICYRTNFKDAKLGSSLFEPVDAFGMTVTLECGTFQNMRTSQQWFLCWLLLATLMIPEADRPVKLDFKELLIGVIGAERFVKLRALFARRDL